MNILVTGGAGYIGSHTVLELLNAGHAVVVVDNLSNSSRESLRRVEELTGKQVTFHETNVCDEAALTTIFDKYTIDAVIHFAGLKAVGESVAKPLLYYRNNLESALTLLNVMKAHNVTKLVFSSSATIYGTPISLPYVETMPLNATNPYGRTKQMIEYILQDASAAGDGWNITSLRYFNPVGAHESGRIGEDPNGIPNNLMPYVSQVAVGKRSEVHVFGDDYDTPDGTGIRDYIHVTDLAKAHVAALEHLDHPNEYKAYNIGTGKGVSVHELINAFRHASGQEIPVVIDPRRPGDLPAYYANTALAEQELGWKAKLDINKICEDTWRWQSQNPNGYIK